MTHMSNFRQHTNYIFLYFGTYFVQLFIHYFLYLIIYTMQLYAVQFHLFVTCVLFLSREGFRRACMRADFRWYCLISCPQYYSCLVVLSFYAYCFSKSIIYVLEHESGSNLCCHDINQVLAT